MRAGVMKPQPNAALKGEAMKRTAGHIAILCGLCFLLFATGCTSVDLVNGKRVQNMYLVEEDIKLGQDYMKQTVTEMEKMGVPINADSRQVAKLRKITRDIAAVSHKPDLPFEVTLFHTGIVNAAAAPGGQMMVFEGLYTGKDALVNDDDELAAVIGHEIAHVTCRHTTERLTSQMPVNMLLLAAAIYAEVKEDEDVASAVDAAFFLYHGVWVPRYSREDELEADAVGLLYMAKAGYDPRAALRIWERGMKKETVPSWLNALAGGSHPTDRQRYEAMQRQLSDALQAYQATHTQEAAGSTPTRRP